jgi:hypothetical protein
MGGQSPAMTQMSYERWRGVPLESLPNKRINLTRPTLSVVSSTRGPRRLRAVRSTELSVGDDDMVRPEAMKGAEAMRQERQ